MGSKMDTRTTDRYEVTVTQKDGSEATYTTLGVPWNWRTFLCMQDAESGRKVYVPNESVESFTFEAVDG